VRNLRVAIESVKKAGKHAQGAISYTTSPVHSIPQFVDMAKEMQEMGCESIVIKDMAGLLTPMVSAELTKHLVEALEVPVHVHSHATSGLSEMSQLKAIENGCRHIDTAISSMAGGTSHPPTETMVAALRNTEYDTGIDLEAVQEIGFYFYEVRKKYHQFESEHTGVDTRVQVNQVPGGMISNLANQLKEQGSLQRMNEVLKEIPRVREDLGYPPLVTPSSQIVGTQAVLNVLTGARYKTMTNEVKLCLQGRYGKAPGPVNEAVRQQAIGNEEVIECRPADLLKDEMDELRRQIGELAQTKEDVLTYAMFPEIGRQFLKERTEGNLQPEPLEPIPDKNESSIPTAPTDFNVNYHGESYHIEVKGTGQKSDTERRFFLTLDGVPTEILVETLDQVVLTGGAMGAVPAKPGKKTSGQRPQATKEGHVTTSMPGVIVDVLVSEGDQIKAGDPVLITEAMKMETEVQAPISGKVVAINVAKGDSVNPDEALVEIE
jgi:pyruvate carboxylase subunit B